MPRRDDLHTIMVIGSGPIVIGQACEFDYSGTQACKVLRREGYEVSLVNSNPATIMTDPEFADRTYIEPLDPASVARRASSANAPTRCCRRSAGRPALNVAVALAESGRPRSARRPADRREPRGDPPRGGPERRSSRRCSRPAWRCRGRTSRTSLDEALALGDAIGYPVIVRPSFTLGGGGSGFAHSREELRDLARAEPARSRPVGEILVEESIAGWKEFELEVMRDGEDNARRSCARSRTSTRWASTPATRSPSRPCRRSPTASTSGCATRRSRCIRAIGVETGGSNIQFAVRPARRPHGPDRDEPARVALVGARVEGHRVPDREDRRAARRRVPPRRDHATTSPGETPAAFEPTLDYVVVKIPRFAFEKFPRRRPRAHVDDEVGGRGHGDRADVQGGARQGAGAALEKTGVRRRGARRRRCRCDAVAIATERRLAARRGARSPRGHTVDEVAEASSIDPWFVDQIAQVAEGADAAPRPTARDARRGRAARGEAAAGCPIARHRGASRGATEAAVRRHREALGVAPVFKTVDTCAGEFAARTPYHYSTYEDETEVRPAERPRVVILGVGPEPDRAGDRVRLRVRARGVRAARRPGSSR